MIFNNKNMELHVELSPMSLGLEVIKVNKRTDYYVWVGPLHIVISKITKAGETCHGNTKLCNAAVEGLESLERDRPRDGYPNLLYFPTNSIRRGDRRNGTN
jgi:hypothetical protein